MMKKIFGWIFSRWTLLILGLIALAILILLVGPLIAIGSLRPLESLTSRWVLIGLIVLLVILKQVWNIWRARRASNALAAGFAAQAAEEPVAKAGDAEIALIGERFKEAIETLRKSRLGGSVKFSQRVGRGYLYQLPWYVFIGAPGSGKTTSLLNSGLEFPLADKFGKEAIRGVGGTRNCDWWFTNEAILLDTAGRYTTQDSSQAEDSAAWGGFLQLLRKNRPRRPINGVLVTVSIQDLLSRNQLERERQAIAIRKRVAELYSQLGIRIPIYVLVTKTDLLPGFMEFFENLGKEEREQVVGFTLPHSDAKAGLEKDALRNLYEKEFSLISRRFFDGMIDRLEAERDPSRRALIYGFPQQFSAIKEVLGEFLIHAFAAGHYDEPPLMRGVYFTSGTQEDSPIDRIMGVLARTFKVEKRVLPAHSSTGRSYFITKLLREVIFRESELAGTNIKWERRRSILQVAAFAAIGVFGLALMVGWAYSYKSNQKYLLAVNNKIPNVVKVVEAFPNIETTDPVPLLPPLNELRTIAAVAPVTIDLDAPNSMKLGLFQGEKIDAAGRAAYQKMLTDALLPRIARRIEELLRGAKANQPEYMYETLKAYLMLHDAEHYDAQALKQFITADWEISLPREVSTEQRVMLESHLDQLLSRGLISSPIPMDKVLVESSRSTLKSMTLAQRIYSRLKRLGVGSDIPDFQITRAAGPAAPLVYSRVSGVPLDKGVPGLFTYNGYHNAFKRQVEVASLQLAAEEGWVLGVDKLNGFDANDAIAKLRLNEEVKRLYLEDYAQTWEKFIADIRFVKQSGLPQVIQLTRTLSAADSPLPVLMRAIVKEVTLTEKLDGTKFENTTNKITTAADDVRKGLIGILTPNQPRAGQSTQPRQIESIVDDRFVVLRSYVRSPGPNLPAEVEKTVQLLSELNTHLNAVQVAVASGAALPQSDVPNKVKTEAARLGEPMRSAISGLVTSGITESHGQMRAMMGANLQAQVGDFCEQAIAGRYPLNRGSTREATPDDFARMFKPGGLMDDFFQKNLIQYVDTSTTPWKFRDVGGAKMGDQGEASAALMQFQRAAAIKDTFFRNGGAAPSLRVDFKPVEMDKDITQFILDVDGTPIKYAHGPQTPQSVVWPGSGGRSRIQVQVTPNVGGLAFEGPWALFRMFDKMQLESLGQPERFKGTFNIEGRKIVFEITTSSIQNPFRLPEMNAFACPGKL